MDLKLIILLTGALTVGAAVAAEPGARTHPDPECLNRDADPEKCVIQDGPPPLPQVRKKVDLPPPIPVPKPPEPRQTAPLARP